MAQDPFKKSNNDLNKEQDFLLIQDFNQLNIQDRFELILDIYGYNVYKESENRITEFITAAIQESKNWNELPINYLEEWFNYQAGYWFDDPNYKLISRKEREEEDRAILLYIKHFGYNAAVICDEDVQYNFELFFHHPFKLPPFTYKWSVLAALIRRNLNFIYQNQFERITIDSNRINMLLVVLEQRKINYALSRQQEELKYEKLKKNNGDMAERELLLTKLDDMSAHIVAAQFIINAIKRINNCNLKNIKINKSKSRRNTLYIVNNNNNNNDSTLEVNYNDNENIDENQIKQEKDEKEAKEILSFYYQ